MSGLDPLKGGLIVSCQATEDSPLYNSQCLSVLAVTAEWSGAQGLRLNGPQVIRKAARYTSIPIIGLEKKTYADSTVYITPTRDEAKRVVKAGAPIVAIDGTARRRPRAESLEDLVSFLKNESPVTILADVDSLEAGLRCEALGVDAIATTLAGYTTATEDREIPDFELLQQLCGSVSVPVICEGGISDPAQLVKAFSLGAFAVCVGRAITGFDWIIKRYLRHLPDHA